MGFVTTALPPVPRLDFVLIKEGELSARLNLIPRFEFPKYQLCPEKFWADNGSRAASHSKKVNVKYRLAGGKGLRIAILITSGDKYLL